MKVPKCDGEFGLMPRHKWARRHGLVSVDLGFSEVLVWRDSCVYCGRLRERSYSTGRVLAYFERGALL